MPSAGPAFHFGAFSLYPSSRLLLEDGQPVRLGARALDLLIALVEQPGAVVAKEALFRRVWPNTIVEETSLRVHVAALRKALGGSELRYIANIPGKGYAFTGELKQEPSAAPAGPASRTGPRHNLPIRLTRMIGRGASVPGIASALLTHRFVTITGEGGVGKTTMALAVAEDSLDEYPDGVAFVDLAWCTAAGLLVSTVGRALGLVLPAHAPAHLLAEALRDQRFLLVVDNCEHLIAESTALVTGLLRQLPVLRILTTSREALRADGEYVHRLETLPVPPPGDALQADAALRFASIQLLVERVAAANDHFALTDADTPFAAELCRRLDGVPLAIELAAARVSFFGLQGLVDRLNDRLLLLSSGHRTVMPRHRTLRALYDWSFDLLGERARLAYARLAVFPASFSLDAALALMPCDERAEALPMFLDLIAKSLVAVDVQGDSRRYRLLDTAQFYAREKLVQLDGGAAARRAQGRWLQQALRDANAQWDHAGRHAWVAQHGALAEDVGDLLGWARDDTPSAVLYAQVLDAAYLLFQELSQLEVLRPHIAHARALLRDQHDHDPSLTLRLTVLAGQAMSHCLPQPTDALHWLEDARTSLERPDAAPDVIYAATALHMQHAEYRQMLRMAERLETAGEVAGDAQSVLTARRFQAVAHHSLGNFRVSRALAAQVLQQPTPTLRTSMPFDNVDRRVPLGIALTRAAWIEGDAVEAARLLETVGEQVANEVERFQCQFLALTAIPIALWNEQRALALARLAHLQRLVARPHLGDFWTAWADAFACVLDDRLPTMQHQPAMLLDMLAATAPAFHSSLALARAHSGLAGWSAAEVLRHHGERIQTQAPDEAEQLFMRSRDLAREQGAVRWELRAAISLARFALAQGRPRIDDRSLLAPLARMRVEGADQDVTATSELLSRGAP